MIKYKSITNSMRHVCVINKESLSKQKSNFKLFISSHKSNTAGRNNSGHITVFTKSVRHKKLYRIIDFKRDIYDVPAIVYTNEYDPNRSSFISLIIYKNNICAYILSIGGLKIGDIIYTYSSERRLETLYKKGDCNLLCNLPIGTIIHNLEYLPKNGFIYIRSAGTYGKIIRKVSNSNTILIQLPSKYFFYASQYSKATIGAVSNPHHNEQKLGKAGRSRWLGIKPNVRGVAMNPIDHPHGGGEGKRSADSFKKSPWGKISKWYNKKVLHKLL